MHVTLQQQRARRTPIQTTHHQTSHGDRLIKKPTYFQRQLIEQQP